ncbi:hypothetical protein UFOVP53_153 [uncultured Caudovirales phage]|uniref:Uncharacterized protein n=1 Tax=uncultured Caudovirales phage TaxID=2100421 RepID=A0A6J5KSN4_9CAUD|nr:hypothetical protein UFOVP53_153 [uncultured Caudovirales phage]
MIVVNRLGKTLIKIGIIKLTYDANNPLSNLEIGSLKAFGLIHCKEYVERYAERGLFPIEIL